MSAAGTAPESRGPSSTSSVPARLASGIRRALPTGRTLPPEVFAARHRWLLGLLWAHVPGLFAVGMAAGVPVRHSALEAALVAAIAVAGTLPRLSRRTRATIVSLGLITCSAVLVHLSGGYIEAHFHFFVMIGLLSLYEDWLPFLLAAGYVVLHHGIGGAVSPEAVFNHPDAVARPWKWALIHGLFVTGAGVASVLAWRLNEATRAQLTDANRDLAHAQHVSGIGSWRWDLETDEVTWSKELHRLLGSDPASEASYERFLEFVHPHDRAEVSRHVAETVSTGRQLGYDTRLLVNGEVRLAHARGEVTTDRDGRPVRVFGTLQDVTHQRRAERDLFEAKERFRHAFDDAPIGVMLVSVEGSALGAVLQANQAAAAITGYAQDELAGREFASLTHPDDRERHDHAAARLASGDLEGYELEKQYVHADGTPVWVHVNASLVHGNRGEPLYAIAQIQDVTERKEAEEQLRHQALHDSLTGLANRALFQDRLNHSLQSAKRHGGSVAVLFLDLDNFKLVNDTLGHPVGDEMLLAVARRLSELTRPSDTVARLSGDEFGIICDQLNEPSEAIQVAERLTEVLALPLSVGDRELVTTASIGIVTAEPDSTTESLLRDADVAMYRAKAGGPGRYEIFDPVMRRGALARLDTEHALRRALERSEFRLVYQPIVELATGRTIACEALIRWNRPGVGSIAPDDFIPLAEETGMIIPIGRWVLSTACMEARRWQDTYGMGAPILNVNLSPRQVANGNGNGNGHDGEPADTPSVNVNISPRQLSDPDLVRHVTDALAASGLEARSLCLEITESTMVGSFERATEALTLLRDLGVTAAIDDFGAGVSSLGRLKQLPLEVLKIDKAFVDELGVGGDDRAIIAAVNALAEALDLTAVAEGVETESQAEALRSLGCHAAQGFYFSPPLEPEELAAFLEAGPGLASERVFA